MAQPQSPPRGPPQGPPQGGPQIQIQVPPGAPPPTPEQIAHIQRQITQEAAKAGVSVQEYVARMRMQAMRQQQIRMQQQQQQGGQLPPGQPGPGQPGPPGPQQAKEHQQQLPPPPQPEPPKATQIPLNGSGGPPKPEALAVANFLKSQELKSRISLFNNERKEMFRVKRAIRALESPAYQKARTKNPLLPEVKDRVTAENVFKMLPMSLLALRVSKVDPHEGHGHAPKKGVKGLWTVKVEQHQEAHDDMHYIWLYEGSQWKMKLYAVGAVILILAVVFFPIWPYSMRLGVWYLSMGCLGLLGLFFAMALFRLILFLITLFAVPPGLWLYPNLFEDVGFFDSFKPTWAWQETKESRKTARAAKRAKKQARVERRDTRVNGHQPGHVEEVEDEEEEGDEVENESGEEEVEDAGEVETVQASGVEASEGTVQHRASRGPTVEEAADDE